LEVLFERAPKRDIHLAAVANNRRMVSSWRLFAPSFSGPSKSSTKPQTKPACPECG
jgi:hypothetical protein